MYFGSYYVFPNLENTSMQHLEAMVNGTCRKRALVLIGINLMQMMASNNPDASNCGYFADAVDQAVWDFLECPEDNENPYDPYPPGGGSGDPGYEDSMCNQAGVEATSVVSD